MYKGEAILFDNLMPVRLAFQILKFLKLSSSSTPTPEKGVFTFHADDADAVIRKQ